ncbi:MAG TPA: 4-hydroxy-tetrahydrodipicolinate reductase [Candidatus Paceibacterota bacterium]
METKPIRFVVTGSKGKMGKTLVACAQARPAEFEVAGQVDMGDNLGVIGQADVVVDFSSPDLTYDLTRLCVHNKKPIIIGTTGQTGEEPARIRWAAECVPVVKATNFSTGVNTLFWLTRKAAEILGPGFDLEIVETHHRMKKDAPSGTAKSLAEILAEVRGTQLKEVARHGRQGIVGERTTTEIGIHAVRGGDVVGDHTVIFASIGERVELTHKASSRETFANGALRAAQWVVGKPPGLYSMMDVLGLK